VRADRRHSENSTAEVVQNEKPDELWLATQC
jgi:hypothetical protein